MKFKRLAAAVMAAVLAVSSVPVSGFAAVKKDTGSKQLLATMLRNSSQSASNAKVNLSLNAEAATMKLGEKKTLTVTVATASNASPSNATASDSNAVASASNAIEWKSDSALVTVTQDDSDPKKAEVEVIGYQKDAKTVTITAFVENVPGVDDASAECKVTISAPVLKVETDRTSIGYDEQAEVTAKMTNVDSAWEMDMDELRYSCEGPVVAETKNGVAAISSDGTGAFGRATITAEYGEIAAGSVEINLNQPTLAVTAEKTTIDMAEQRQVKLEISDSLYEYDDYLWTVDDSAVADISGNGDTAVLTAKKAGTVIVTAAGKADEGIEGAKATRKITIKDSRKLAWKGEAKESVDLYINNAEKDDSAKLEIINDYGVSKWTVADDAVAEIVPSADGKSAVLTAKAEGTTTLTITAADTEKELVLTVNVYNAGKLAWAEEQEGPVQLYLNNEEKSDTATLNIINNFAKAKWSLSNDEVAELVLSEDGKKAAVTAKAAGTTTLTVTADGTDAELTLTILVVDSADNVEVVGSETEVTVPDEVIENVEIPEIDTEGLTDEQKQFIEENKAAIEASVKEAVKKAAEGVAQNEAAKTLPPTGLDAALKAAGILEDGEKATVYLKQEVKDIQITTTTIVEADGTVTVKPVITGMVFDITPHMASVDENGKKIEGTEQNVADAINTVNKTITLTIPVPDGVAFNYADIQHQGSTTTAKITKTANGNYIRTSVRHFSEFVITFTNKAPSTSGGGGGGARSASVKTYVPTEPGQWILNETGWWYKYNDGTYPAAQWVQLPWNGVNTWYYFDAQGYLTTGWMQDGTNTYYLHPEADGNRGYMYTGWHQIDGKWYYFHTMEGGPLGAMAVNTRTPDGFTVGADGVWVQ